VRKKAAPVKTTRVEIHRLKGRRKGATLKEQVWFEDGQIVGYSLAYINLKECPVDNGRVLGYDNSHAYHHRHFMGRAGPIEFTTYSELLERFIREVRELWRIEDEKNTNRG
jgi:hypothetical protein